MEIGDVGLRILFVEDVNAPDVILRGHRMGDADRHRYRVAVLDQRRDVELDLAGAHRRTAGDVLDRGGKHGRRRLRGTNGDDGERAEHSCATGEAEELAA